MYLHIENTEHIEKIKPVFSEMLKFVEILMILQDQINDLIKKLDVEEKKEINNIKNNK